MELDYILFSFICAGLPCMYTGVCNKMRDLIRLIFAITLIVIYYINKWATADIDVGFFVCWCIVWSMILDQLYKKFKWK